MQPDAAHVIPCFSFIFAAMKAAQRGAETCGAGLQLHPKRHSFWLQERTLGRSAAVVGGGMSPICGLQRQIWNGVSSSKELLLSSPELPGAALGLPHLLLVPSSSTALFTTHQIIPAVGPSTFGVPSPHTRSETTPLSSCCALGARQTPPKVRFGLDQLLWSCEWFLCC